MQRYQILKVSGKFPGKFYLVDPFYGGCDKRRMIFEASSFSSADIMEENNSARIGQCNIYEG